MVIDGHFHLLGSGSSGSSCWLRAHGYQSFLARIILWQLGLSSNALSQDFDRIYQDWLLRTVESSSLEKVVLLANDLAHDEKGKPISSFGAMYTPNDYLMEVCSRSPRLLPGVSIHPARADALEELDKRAEQGAVLLKLLPNCHNLNCSDPRYTVFWERLAKHRLPFLAHTGGELSLPVFNAAYADPKLLKLPLECGVTVIAAHCGTSSLIFDRNYVEDFKEMLDRYPNLYGDNSGMLTPLRVRHFWRLREQGFEGRILYGSDLPIPISGIWALLWGLISYKEFRGASRIENILERDIAIKRAMGFKAESFVKLAELLPLR